MKCPKCGKEGFKYVERKQQKTSQLRTIPKRTNFTAKCKKCGWEGI